MPSRSVLARLQQALVLGLAFGAAAWLAWHFADRPLLAVVGALLIAFGFALVLLAQFLLLWRFGAGDPAPAPTAAQLARAWLAEALHALLVFGWRQPFRWRAQPDHLGQQVHGRRGVVLVHGFVCNRGFWIPWMEALRARGHGFVAVNLEPVFGSIDDYAPIIEAAVRRVREASGMPPVLVCHSMGGLAARAWIRSRAGQVAVAGVLTLGSPHHGTWLARFSHTRNGRQMRQGSDWLRQLERDEAAWRSPPFSCWYADCDNVVFPVSSAAREGADNRLVRGAAHVELAFRDEVMDEVIGRIGRL